MPTTTTKPKKTATAAKPQARRRTLPATIQRKMAAEANAKADTANLTGALTTLSKSAVKPLDVLKPAKAPTAKAAPKRPQLRVWVSGVPVGVNHAQTGTGKGRHRTEKALSWADSVWHAVYGAAQAKRLQGETAWGILDGARVKKELAVALHFFVADQWRAMDVDAPLKQTLDEVCRALKLDDFHVRRVECAQSTVEEQYRYPALKKVAGVPQGPTRQGCWVEVRRLTLAELKALDAVEPGAPV